MGITEAQAGAEWCWSSVHRENGGALGMVPLIINPIYTLHSGCLLGIYMGQHR